MFNNITTGIIGIYSINFKNTFLNIFMNVVVLWSSFKNFWMLTRKVENLEAVESESDDSFDGETGTASEETEKTEINSFNRYLNLKNSFNQREFFLSYIFWMHYCEIEYSPSCTKWGIRRLCEPRWVSIKLNNDIIRRQLRQSIFFEKTPG